MKSLRLLQRLTCINIYNVAKSSQNKSKLSAIEKNVALVSSRWEENCKFEENRVFLTHSKYKNTSKV